MPATTESLRSAALRAASITVRTPAGSAATGFSMKTCAPASIAAAKCVGRNPGGVARIAMSTPVASTCLYASKPVKTRSSGTIARAASFGSISPNSWTAPFARSANMSPIA